MAALEITDAADRTQVVILGASNVTLGFAHILRVLSGGLSRPVDLFCCQGHGRSYGQWSYAAVRGLPAIIDSGLFDALPAPSPLSPRLALITDIGNDLLYGHSPERIAGWIQQVIQRLDPDRTQLVLTQLPLAALSELGKMRFHLVRSVFFPGCRITWDEMHEHVSELARLLSELAAAREVQLVEPPAEWYGWDPVHVRHSRRLEAWRQICSHWQPLNASPDQDSPGRLSWLPLTRFRPKVWKLGPKAFESAQPVGALGNVRLHLY